MSHKLRPSKRSKRMTQEELEQKLFGATAVLQQPSVESADDGGSGAAGKVQGAPSSAWFTLDTTGSGSESGEDDAIARALGRDKSTSADAGVVSLRPAWQDDDAVAVDVGARAQTRKLRKDGTSDVVSREEYEERLRGQFTRIHPVASATSTSWAALPEGGVDNAGAGGGLPGADGTGAASGGAGAGGEGILGDTRFFQNQRSSALPPNELAIARCTDANVTERTKGVVRAVQFHPREDLLLTAGLDKTLRLFHIDGRENTKLQSFHFRDMPVYSACFTSNGNQIICAGRRPFFYVVDLECGAVEKAVTRTGKDERSLEHFELSPDGATLAFSGKDGYIHLVSTRTKHNIGCLRASQPVRSLAFSADGRILLSGGEGGALYSWDLRSQRCLGVADDHGAQLTSSIAVASSGAYGEAKTATSTYVATGSDSGVVNIYTADSVLSPPARSGGAAATLETEQDPFVTDRARPAPHKELLNLVTTVDTLAFDPSGQILAMASRLKRDSLRLVHVPTFTVFQNWPTPKTPLRYVHSLAFSPTSRYMAIGNDAGKVLLYRLNHF